MPTYHIRVKLFSNLENWTPPKFPKCSSDIENVKEQASDLCYLYEKVAVFQGENLIEEIQ